MATKDEDEIRELIDGWLEASTAGDEEKVLEMMAEDVVFLAPGREPIRGRTEFAATQMGTRGLEMEAQAEVEEVRVCGDWAFAWTQLTVVIKPSGNDAPVKRTGPVLSVLRKVNGKWMLYRDANMLSVVPPPSGT
jgi:uncharacterized protein (TIGR02246 family)